tara:strand:+ start:8808 stop:9125 length:318 start_codon:yes stop_codon:yes gene_type:complete
MRFFILFILLFYVFYNFPSQGEESLYTKEQLDYAYMLGCAGTMDREAREKCEKNKIRDNVKNIKKYSLAYMIGCVIVKKNENRFSEEETQEICLTLPGDIKLPYY